MDMNCIWAILLSLPDLFDNLTKRKINCCRRLKPNRKEMSHDLLPQNNWLKWDDILPRTKHDLTAIAWNATHTKWQIHTPISNKWYFR
jgi:hypothetical protein